MQTPLSGSHLGPHTRPMCPCNKAVCIEAVGSFVTLFNAVYSSINSESTPRSSTTKKPIQVDKAGSPCKGLGICVKRLIWRRPALLLPLR